jgi:AcrR family transcriptional regulator
MTTSSPRSTGPRASTARRELVENEIYENAIRLFAERGFAGTSLQDIADALGITRPALYYYVKSKDELLAKLAADVAGGSAAQITRSPSVPTWTRWASCGRSSGRTCSARPTSRNGSG